MAPEEGASHPGKIHKVEMRSIEAVAVAVICPSKERLSGGGSSLAVPSEDRWARSQGAARGLPSLAGGEAGPQGLHGFHQVHDSTQLLPPFQGVATAALLDSFRFWPSPFRPGWKEQTEEWIPV